MYVAVAAYAVNNFASPALSGFSEFQFSISSIRTVCELSCRLAQITERNGRVFSRYSARLQHPTGKR